MPVADPRKTSVVDGVETFAGRVIRGALDDIRAAYPDGEIPPDVKVALADHFWCDLLAQLAHAIDEGLKHIDSVPDRLADWVMKSREQSPWRPIERQVVLIAARSAWSKVRLLAFGELQAFRY